MSVRDHVRTPAGSPFAARSNYLKAGSKAVSAVINRIGRGRLNHRKRGVEIVSEPFEHHLLRMARASKPESWPPGLKPLSEAGPGFGDSALLSALDCASVAVAQPTVGGPLLGGEGYQTPWQIEGRTLPPTGWRSSEDVGKAVTE